VAASLATATALSGAAAAQDEAAVRGQAVFDHLCAPCHARGPGDDGREMLPGTAALQIKYRGEVPPALEDRDDLSADLLAVFLRQGTFSMPPFRPTELSDQDIANIAAYLASSLSDPD
jgi:mono/diheme cytochrome c family protein